jgi:hypothetical protein
VVVLVNHDAKRDRCHVTCQVVGPDDGFPIRASLQRVRQPSERPRNRSAPSWPGVGDINGSARWGTARTGKCPRGPTGVRGAPGSGAPHGCPELEPVAELGLGTCLSVTARKARHGRLGSGGHESEWNASSNDLPRCPPERSRRGLDGSARSLPLWSTSTPAARTAKIWGNQLRVVPISLDAWRDSALPADSSEGFMIGVDWSDPVLSGGVALRSQPSDDSRPGSRTRSPGRAVPVGR